MLAEVKCDRSTYLERNIVAKNDQYFFLKLDKNESWIRYSGMFIQEKSEQDSLEYLCYKKPVIIFAGRKKIEFVARSEAWLNELYAYITT